MEVFIFPLVIKLDDELKQVLCHDDECLTVMDVCPGHSHENVNLWLKPGFAEEEENSSSDDAAAENEAGPK